MWLAGVLTLIDGLVKLSYYYNVQQGIIGKENCQSH